MAVSGYSVSKGLKVGAVGGVIGALVQGILGSIAVQAVGQEIFFVTIARKWGFGDASVAGGWGLHIVTGLLIGAIFVAVTASVRQLGLTKTPRAIGFGAGVGILAWIVLLLPMTYLFLPKDLAMTEFVVGGLIFHILFGVVTAFTAYSLLRKRTTETVQG